MTFGPGALSPDGRRLFTTRLARLFAYGFLSVVLLLYLAEIGFNAGQMGLLLTLTLAGDTVISLLITTRADRWGRRRMLIVGALLMISAGAVFALSRDFLVLLAAATIGVISPSGNEVGPFLPIEQAALSEIVPDARRTRVFAWYNLVGSFATGAGSLCGGGLAQLLQGAGRTPLESYRVVIVGYAAIGFFLGFVFRGLTRAVEAAPGAGPPDRRKSRFGLGPSRGVVFKLAGLFSVDAFAGGFMLQSLVAYWFHVRFGVEPGLIGAIFMGANVLAGVSALSAAWVASKIGLVRTMVFTHLPSNVLLILVPLMPNLPLAITMLLLRFSISQMDVPTRQSLTMALVRPDERSAAAGVTGIARTTGASAAPVIAGPLLAGAGRNIPFFLSGGLKILYDILLYRTFRAVRIAGEKGAGPAKD